MATLQDVTSSRSRGAMNPHITQPFENQEVYHELTRRLPPEELQDVEEHLSHVTEEHVERLCAALERQNWDAAVFQEEKYPYYALKAVQGKKISLKQFTTVMFHWVNFTKNKKKYRFIPLFGRDGKVDRQARELIRQTLVHKTPLPEHSQATKNVAFFLGYEIDLSDKESCYLTDQQFKAFIEEMRNEPVSEQNFFLFDLEEAPSIAKAIHDNGINVFGQTREGWMVPSFSMMQAYLKVKFGSRALHLKSVLGFSSPRDIRNGILTDERDLAVPFPGTTLPPKADKLEAPGYFLCWHDFYHAIMASYVVAKYRILLMKLGDVAESFYNQTGYKLAHEFAGILYDMEHSLFRDEVLASVSKARRKDMNYSFWYTLAIGFTIAKTRTTEVGDILIINPEERQFLGEVISKIPYDLEYKECTGEAHLAVLEKAKKDREAIQKKGLIYPPGIFAPLEETYTDLVSRNLFKVMHDLWTSSNAFSKLH